MVEFYDPQPVEQKQKFARKCNANEEKNPFQLHTFHPPLEYFSAGTTDNRSKQCKTWIYGPYKFIVDKALL